MVLEAVRQLVTQLSEKKEQVDIQRERLRELTNGHFQFWVKMQQDCEKTFHNLTIEEFESIKQKSIIFSEQINSATCSYYKLQGHECPYCKAYVNGSLIFHDERIVFKKNFQNYFNQDTSMWPDDKKEAFKKGKQEVEEYFKEAEFIEKTIQDLKEECSEIEKQLDRIVSVCNIALGYYFYKPEPSRYPIIWDND